MDIPAVVDRVTSPKDVDFMSGAMKLIVVERYGQTKSVYKWDMRVHASGTISLGLLTQ